MRFGVAPAQRGRLTKGAVINAGPLGRGPRFLGKGREPLSRFSDGCRVRFFFQAEDGIRDVAVMEFRRVLFRSVTIRGCINFNGTPVAAGVYHLTAVVDVTLQLVGTTTSYAYMDLTVLPNTTSNPGFSMVDRKSVV